MKTVKLKVSRLLFRWYYKRCGDFFGKWHFTKSVKLLIENYEHQTLLYNNGQEHISSLIIENRKLSKVLFDIKMKSLASDGQIDWANRTLGTNIHKDSEN